MASGTVELWLPVVQNGGSSGSSGPVLVTGGVGYIGSHTVVELLNRGYDVVVVDNLCNSNIKCLERVSQITGSAPAPHL